MIFLGLLGLVGKLYRPSESNMLFDGGSLVLYMCGIVVYVANIVKGLRIVTLGTYFVTPAGVGVDGGAGAGAAADGPVKETVVGREDNLKVLSASNTILALVLVGVLILQAGQWYAERADERERVNIREAEKEQERLREESEERSGNGAGSGGGGGGGGAGRRSGQKEELVWDDGCITVVVVRAGCLNLTFLIVREADMISGLWHACVCAHRAEKSTVYYSRACWRSGSRARNFA